MDPHKMLGLSGQIVVNQASILFLPPNPDRVALLLSPPSTGRIAVSDKNPTVLDSGVVMFTSGFPLVLTVREVGDWLHRSLYINSSAAATNVGFIEVIQPGWSTMPGR